MLRVTPDGNYSNHRNLLNLLNACACLHCEGKVFVVYVTKECKRSTSVSLLIVNPVTR